MHRWLAKRPRFHLHFTPTHGSWLNQVERWFGLLTQRQLRRGSHTSSPLSRGRSRSSPPSTTTTPSRFAGPPPPTTSSRDRPLRAAHPHRPQPPVTSDEIRDPGASPFAPRRSRTNTSSSSMPGGGRTARRLPTSSSRSWRWRFVRSRTPPRPGSAIRMRLGWYAVLSCVRPETTSTTSSCLTTSWSSRSGARSRLAGPTSVGCERRRGRAPAPSNRVRAPGGAGNRATRTRFVLRAARATRQPEPGSCSERPRARDRLQGRVVRGRARSQPRVRSTRSRSSPRGPR